MEIPAIDYQKLYKEEKRRAREEHRRKTQQRQPDYESDKRQQQQQQQSSLTENETNQTPAFPAWGFEKSLHVPDAFDLEKHCVCKEGPGKIYYYCPDEKGVLSEDYAQALQDWLLLLEENPISADNNSQRAAGKWNRLKHAKRRVALLEEDKETGFPNPLREIVDWLVQTGIFPKDCTPNHILINEYYGCGESSGIMPHTDGPAYFPRTATISIGGPVLLNFTPSSSSRILDNNHENVPNHKSSKDAVQVVLSGSPTSLVVFQDEAYSDYLHGIDAVTPDNVFEYAKDCCVNADPGTKIVRENHRISLTFRRKKELTHDKIT